MNLSTLISMDALAPAGVMLGSTDAVIEIPLTFSSLLGIYHAKISSGRSQDEFADEIRLTKLHIEIHAQRMYRCAQCKHRQHDRPDVRSSDANMQGKYAESRKPNGRRMVSGLP
jgi:hypothetical protein